MINHQLYLDLLKEFCVLIDKPENKKYRQENGSLDYIGLVIDDIAFVNVGEVPVDHPRRIVFVHGQLTYMLEDVSTREINGLQAFLREHGYKSRVHVDQEINFTITTPTFDFTIILD